MSTGDVRREAEDKEPKTPGIPSWNVADVNGSLQAILLYVEREAAKSISWYWKRKRRKAFCSQLIRFAAFSLTALGGLLPIVILMLNPLLRSMNVAYQVPESGLISSLLVGVAAALLGLDKAFGLSSGWTRYVLTATVLEKTMEEFRLQWTLLNANADHVPAPAQVAALLKCAQDFRIAVSTAVLQETKDWVTEFQNNLGELERDTRAQLESLRAKVEKTAREASEESRPGALELVVSDADRAEGSTFTASLKGQNGVILSDVVQNSKTWTSVGIAPGQYRLQLAGRVDGRETKVTKVLIVRPGETTEIQAKLQI
jgi:hypothetical protein